jgi:hypothetical protein
MTSKRLGLRRSVLKGKGSRNRNSGWRGNWTDRLDIPKAEATPILLTPGEYPLIGKEKNQAASDDNPDPIAHYHTCLYHSVKLRSKGPGSYYTARCGVQAGEVAGLDDEDCLLCFREAQGDQRVQGRYLFSFNVIHFGLYRREKKIGKDGKVVFFEKDSEHHKRGDPVLVWNEVKKPRDRKEVMADLDDLLDLGEESEEDGVVLARKKYIEVGRTHRDQLTEIDEKASQMCRCGGMLEPIAFNCEHCDQEILDVEEANLAPEEVKKFAEERQRCDHCGEVGLPIPVPVCDTCDDPQPLSFFEVVAYIRKAGEGTSTRVEIEKVVRLDEFELPDGSSPIEWDEDEDVPVEDEDGNWVLSEDHGIKKLAESQWNFEKVHAPRDHQFHASRLGCEIPHGFKDSELTAFGGGGGKRTSAKYRNYGSKSADSRFDSSNDSEDEDDDEKDNTPRRRGGRRRRAKR